MDRRFFLKTASAAGALLIYAPLDVFAAPAKPDDVQLGLYVRIAPDNTVTIGVATSEIGQGTNTSVPMLLAEELDVAFDRIKVENIPTPYKNGADGKFETIAFAEGAGGSTAISDSYDGARQAGALARHLLLAAAAKQWNVAVAELTTEQGVVRHAASGRTATYGSLAAAAARETSPAEPLPLKPRAAYRLIGTSQKQLSAHAIVTGAPLFGIDQRIDGMLTALVARSPYLDGTVRTLDDHAARAVPGVRAVVRLPRPALDAAFTDSWLAEGVAVVADNFWAARKGRDALRIDWAPGPRRDDTTAIFQETWAALDAGKTQRVRDVGEVDAAFDKAARVIEARYEVPLVAHATLEPQNTIAEIRNGRVRVITPTQSPFDAATIAAKIAGVDVSKIDMTPVRSGGGFGRRLYTDPIAEAVFLAKAVDKPVKLVWTRECDMAHDLYRPGGAHLLRAALDSEGHITGWLHRVASMSRAYRDGNSNQSLDRHWTSELMLDDHPGSLVANYRIEFFAMQCSAPRGALRAPRHNVNAFAMQAFLGEVATATGRDPLQLRLDLLGSPRDLKYQGHGGPVFSTGRMAGVLRLAAEKAGWNGPSFGTGKGRGIAGHFSFGTYVAHVVDVSMTEKGSFTVDRVTSAVDCGLAVNPNGVTMQNEGAINDALSVTLGQAITLKDGQVEQSNFDTYPMARIDRAATQIETHIVTSDAPPRGMGEPSVPPFAPALTGALFAASGKRIRKLPIGDQLV